MSRPRQLQICFWKTADSKLKTTAESNILLFSNTKHHCHGQGELLNICFMVCCCNCKLKPTFSVFSEWLRSRTVLSLFTPEMFFYLHIICDLESNIKTMENVFMFEVLDARNFFYKTIRLSKVPEIRNRRNFHALQTMTQCVQTASKKSDYIITMF